MRVESLQMSFSAFSDKVNFKRHHVKIHQETEIAKNYQCDICDFKFDIPSKLKTHFRDVHEKMKVSCTLCNKDYSKSNITTHIKLSHGTNVFKCTICEKELKSKQSLHQHQATEHGLKTANINHKCSICSKEFTQKAHLRTHMRGLHRQTGFKYHV